MVRKCRATTGEVAVMDMALLGVGVTTRARAQAMAAPSATDSTAGAAKKRKIGTINHPVKFSESSTCTQAGNSAERRLMAVRSENSTSEPPVEENCSRCLNPSSDDEASASCCSSYRSSVPEKIKLKFNLEDQEESAEVDSSTSHFIFRERREDTSSSEAGEEESDSGMDSVAAAKLTEVDTLPRSKEEFSGDELDLFLKLEKPEIVKPTDAEIEDFFAVVEAENLNQLGHFKKKYNFDFAKEKPLEGRFEWRRS